MSLKKSIRSKGGKTIQVIVTHQQDWDTLFQKALSRSIQVQAPDTDPTVMTLKRFSDFPEFACRTASIVSDLDLDRIFPLK
jgi:elongation factor P--beta-lysine ligase